jgi:hypothetical protein
MTEQKVSAKMRRDAFFRVGSADPSWGRSNMSIAARDARGYPVLRTSK